MEQPASAVPWHVTQRDFHSETWESSVSSLDSNSGKPAIQRHRFVSIGSGMNFVDGNGHWQSTREEFQIAPEGYAIAQFGPHSLIVGNNLNAADAIDCLTSDGVRFRAGPIAMALYDPVSGTNLVLGTVRDCSGELTAVNEITFKSCFDGIEASIRMTYKKAGVSQDLLLSGPLPDPVALGMSEHSRIEFYTELTPDTPVPRQSTRVIQDESNEALQAMGVADLFTDSFLDWGAYKMPAGAAFELNGNPASGRLLVAKRFYVTADGRPIIIESIRCADAAKLFASMSSSKNGQTAQTRGQALRLPNPQAAGQASSLPTFHRSAEGRAAACPTNATVHPLRAGATDG